MKRVYALFVLVALVALTVSCSEYVNPTSITLSNHAFHITIGETVKLEAIISPSSATNAKIRWSSETPSVASVDQKGRVTAHMDGQAIIAATTLSNDLSDACIVTVSKTPAVMAGEFPSYFTLPETSNIIATYDTIIIKLELVDDVEYIVISDNLGATWHKPIKNIIGNIVHTHIFSDGTILLCTSTSCYTTSDYETLEQSTVLDIDGSPYNAPKRKGFYSQMYHDKYFFHDGVEMDIFGEYVLEDASTPREKLDARIWYTTDKGHTIKCAFRSGTTKIKGKEIRVRHIHYVGYCEKNEKFYVSTGDNNAESYFLEGIYDASQDAWSFSIIGSGVLFKFGYFWFDDSYAYFLTDYTSSSYLDKKGILRCSIDSLIDINKYKNIYVCPKDEWGEIAIVNMIEYPNGVKVLFPDYLGVGVIWVAKSGYNFQKVSLDQQLLLGYNTMGPNLNNEVFVLARGGTPIHNFNKATKYNLNVLLRRNGIAL